MTKSNLKKTTLATAIAITLSGCGGGTSTGTDVVGIGGSGFISSGAITGFGSVYVNGVKFETDSSSFDIEGTSGAQSDLSVGMIVKVYGTINDDGVTGTATNIVFDDEIQGPIAGLTNPTADTASFTVLGTTVIVDRTLTNFDNVTFDTLANDDNVEVSGFYDSNGDLHASRIELETENEVEIKGTIANLSGDSSTFTINGITVDASSAVLEDLPNGLADGLTVEVEGSYDGTQITATEIEFEDDTVEDSDEFEVEGYITDFVSNSSFKINGITIDASNAALSPSTITLANDLIVEAEGRIVDGVLIASEISLEGGDVEIEAPVTSINLTEQTFEVTPVSNEPSITIKVDNKTEYEDEYGEADSDTIRLDYIQTYMYVKVDGYELEDGSILASKVSITGVTGDNEGVKVESVVEAIDNDNETVQLLGITFETNGATEYEQNESPLADWGAFYGLVTPNVTWVEVEDTDNDGFADKIEIE